MRDNILKAVFIAWAALWLGFFARELFVKKNINDYRILLTRTLEGKHAYVTGDKLYEFLIYCKSKMPEGSTYNIAGIEEGDLESRRAVYYLYPHLRSTDPDFIIDFKRYALNRKR